MVAALHVACVAAQIDFAPIDRYLAQFGVGPGLPALRVTYSNHSTQLNLHGAETEFLFEEATFLRKQPVVTWPAAEGRTFTLAFIDLGRDTGGTSAPTASWTTAPFFPYVHSLWTRCTQSLADCQVAIQRYNPPGNRFTVPNRYTWLLFRHDAARRGALVLAGQPAASIATSKTLLANAGTAFDIRRFLGDNPGLEAVAYNFMHVKGSGTKPKPTRGRRRLVSL